MVIKICVMVGLPASGKSFRSNELLKDGRYDILISSDSIRKELFGSEQDQSNNDLVFKIYYNRLKEALKNKQNVILDATNCTYKARKRIFTEISSLRLKEKIEITAWIMNIPLETLLTRDKNREKSVGDGVIYKFLTSYQHPQYFEGFDSIVYDRFSLFSFDKYEALINKMNMFSQDNPHHIHTLGNHCALVASNYDGEDIMWWAGRLHDTGKLYTKKYDEDGIAHYYNHDCVGTYYIATHPELVNLESWELNKMLFIINNHMHAHRDYKGGKAEEKYRKLFGNEWFDELMQFAEYDRIASGTYKHYQER